MARRVPDQDGMVPPEPPELFPEQPVVGGEAGKKDQRRSAAGVVHPIADGPAGGLKGPRRHASPPSPGPVLASFFCNKRYVFAHQGPFVR